MRFAEQWSWCTVETIRDVTPTILDIMNLPTAPEMGCASLLDGGAPPA